MKLETLQQIIRDTDESALLIESQIVRRVIQEATGRSWWQWRVSHTDCYPAEREVLYRVATEQELSIADDFSVPSVVLLLARPSQEQLGMPDHDLLLLYWRRLFHVTLHREVGESLEAAGHEGFRERVTSLGTAAFEEARKVLTDEGLLVDPSDDRLTYLEFVVNYLELKFFEPHLLQVYFPSKPNDEIIQRLIGKDVDGEYWFRKTRLAKAPDPKPKADDQSDESHDYFHKLYKHANGKLTANDPVTAAILFTKAARVAPAALVPEANGKAQDAIDELIRRMTPALDLTELEVRRWRAVLKPLLDKADQGNRSTTDEAELLRDLQRACEDFEVVPDALSLWAWIRSWGKEPIKRRLESLPYVQVPNQLRSATRRLTAARLNDEDRKTLGHLLDTALERSETRLRARFRPKLKEALQDAGLQPANSSELASLNKTVEELLDGILEGGFFTFAELRDAIARGQLKLPDFDPRSEFLRGDSLLRLDKQLAKSLDGVYRQGEVYTRMLEYVTSLLFGTSRGRWLATNILLPFGGAFLSFQFLWLLEFERRDKTGSHQEIVGSVTGTAMASVAPKSDVSFFGGWNSQIIFHAAWLTVGLFLLGYIRLPMFRYGVDTCARWAFYLLRSILYTWPLRIWNNPFVQKVVRSAVFERLFNVVFKPIAYTALIVSLSNRIQDLGWTAYLFLYLVLVLLAIVQGLKLIEQVGIQIATEFFKSFRSLPAMIRWIANLFMQLVRFVEYLLAVAESWLQVRGRANKVTIGFKSIINLLLTALLLPVIRFYTIVLIEPMINPLKLPLSILFAKFVYPLLTVMGLFTLSPLGSPLVDLLAPWMSWPLAWLFVVGTFYLLPDAVTFLFWEMRENWRLYRANRPVAIRPVIVGPHGETVAGLLQPGFHSGTIPKLFAKLRAAERFGGETGQWRQARACRRSLRELQEAISRFITRDFIAVLKESQKWQAGELTVKAVTLGNNRIRISLALEGAEKEAVLEWEDRNGWLVAGWSRLGWIAELDHDQADVLNEVIAYLYKRAGVDLVREQIRKGLPAEAVHFDIVSDGIQVWYGSVSELPLFYDLNHGVNEITPRQPDTLAQTDGPVISAMGVDFSQFTYRWDDWIRAWSESGAELTDDDADSQRAPWLLPQGSSRLPSYGPAVDGAPVNGQPASGVVVHIQDKRS